MRPGCGAFGNARVQEPWRIPETIGAELVQTAVTRDIATALIRAFSLQPKRMLLSEHAETIGNVSTPATRSPERPRGRYYVTEVNVRRLLQSPAVHRRRHLISHPYRDCGTRLHYDTADDRHPDVRSHGVVRRPRSTAPSSRRMMSLSPTGCSPTATDRVWDEHEADFVNLEGANSLRRTTRLHDLSGMLGTNQTVRISPCAI